MCDTPAVAAARARLELLATAVPNWARQLLDYIARIESDLIKATEERRSALNRRSEVEQLLFDATPGAKRGGGK